jgi:DNA (cytosine-5)-methyltransferase 1
MYGLDLFSGIGGITKALEGYVRPVAYCENDRYAQAVLLSRMVDRSLPHAPIWDDVCSLRGNMLPQPIDIIYGGFPCQDISVAGRGVGLEGKRSGLFFEIARLVSEIRPRFVFLENVPAIRTRGGDIVVGTLAGLGYDCRWDVLSASDVGANHKRERWWLLAHTNSDGTKWIEPEYRKRGRALESGQEMADSSSREQRSTSTQCNERRFQKEILRESKHSDHWSIEPRICRVAHGVPFRVDRLRGLGNAVVPAQAREAFERLIGIK